MTRKEMITACVEDQIERGVIDPKNKAKHIAIRLTGWLRMSKSECERWYNEVFGN